MKRKDASRHEKLYKAVRAHVLRGDGEFERFRHSTATIGDAQAGPADFLFGGPGDLRMPDQVFDRLRWGGQFVFVSDDPDEVEFTAKPFHARKEFVVEQEPARFSDGRVPGFRKDYFYFIARKIHLVHLGEFSNRFTYHVVLDPHPVVEGEYVVRKHVPTVEMMERRLNLRHPNLDMDDLRKRANAFTNEIFPLFLTREVGILKVLNRHLPEQYRKRIPHVVDMKKNEAGYVTNFAMSWLRNAPPGGEPLTQLEFAKQATELLVQLHETAKVIHLDLRPDNMVITEHGVGFIDLGSAVRIGEDLTRSKMLMKMFEQVMISSGIQKMLGQMCDSGVVTSRVIRDGYRKVNRSVDLFFLVLQMTKPLSNPDFQNLVTHDPESTAARMIGALTKRVLKPKDPEKPEYTTAAEVHEGLLKIERHLEQQDALEAEGF